jgi:hypothetical protein
MLVTASNIYVLSEYIEITEREDKIAHNNLKTLLDESVYNLRENEAYLATKMTMFTVVVAYIFLFGFSKRMSSIEYPSPVEYQDRYV